MHTKLRALPADPAPWSATSSTLNSRIQQRALFVGQVVLFGVVIWQFMMLYKSYACAAAIGLADAGLLGRQGSTSSQPDYYQTVPEIFPGILMLCDAHVLLRC